MRVKDTHRMFKTGFSENQKLVIMNDGQMTRLKETLLEMLKDIINLFDKYSLHYTLSGGSVLGAVRHGGFIPWDDDIDLNVPRKDYEMLLEVFHKELGDRYILCSPEKTPEHGMLCAQIKKRGTRYCSINELAKDKEYCGIAIDIFVVENTFNNVILRKLHGFACLGLGYLSTCRNTYRNISYIRPWLTEGSAAAKAFEKKAKIGKLFSLLSLDTVTKAAAKCYSLCKNNQSKYVTIPSGRGHYFKETQLRKDLCGSTDACFENMTVKIPADSDRYLRALYGEDYMQLPPAEKRETHPLMELDFGDLSLVN